MSKSMLNKMNDLIKRMEDMSSEELERFLTVNAARAKHVLSQKYNEDRDFKIIGEESLYCRDIIQQHFCITSENLTYTYEDSNDHSQDLLCMAA